MELVVDLTTGGVMLREHQDLQRLSVQAVPGQLVDGAGQRALGALATAMSVHDVGTVAPDGDVLVRADVLHHLATEAARRDEISLDPAWEAGFTGMVEFATTKGWTDGVGSLRAHVEWRS
jgi:hypothetical protein